MTLTQLVMMLERVRKALGNDYAPQQLSILLLVKIKPGITHTEISQFLSMPQGTVSRNCKMLGTSMHKGPNGVLTKKGYGLVENRKGEVSDPRRCTVHLTNKGKAFAESIQKEINESRTEINFPETELVCPLLL